MADPKAAVDAVLRQEDSRLAGIITNSPTDRGGLTRYGLTAKFHPLLLNAGFFEESTPAATALGIAETTYEADYTGPLCLAQIKSQSIATALLSFAVNEGTHEAVVMLQRSLGICGQRVTEDGQMGAQTVAAVNAADPAKLLGVYCDLEVGFYTQVARTQLNQSGYLQGWLNRVTQDRALKDVVAVQSTEEEEVANA